jgi:uncharacterized membrane protein
MGRRRSTPWLHRWSRLIIAAIAAAGALGTGYLTITKLAGGEAACPTSGCDQVLSSPYATVFGLPLTLFGFLAYATVGALAIAPLLIKPEGDKKLRADLEQWSWLGLLAISTAMAVFSGYLMYLLAFKLKALCIYCLVSAAFSVGLFTLTLLGHVWEDIGQLFFTSFLVAIVTLVGTLGVYSTINGPVPEGATAGEVGPPITTSSGPAEIALAEHLSSIGAKMYSAYWCPHCHDQKQLFGQTAFQKINYVECDPNGRNSQTDLCRSLGEDKLKGYPTWEINGQYVSGTQSLTELADLSGYKGPRNFQNGI